VRVTGTFIGRYRDEYADEKQLQSDGNMPSLPEQEMSRFGRGPMNTDFSPAAASRPAAIDAVRHERKCVKLDSVRHMPFALLNVRAQKRHEQAAGHA
jgi:hypothetical protein